MIGLLLAGGIAAGGSLFGFVKSRNFVRERLRFVDSVQKPSAPLIAGAVATLAATPLAFLPFIGVPSAVLFGLGIGAGVSAGARDARSLPGS